MIRQASQQTFTSYSARDEGLRGAFGFSETDVPYEGATQTWDLEALRAAHRTLKDVAPEQADLFDLVTVLVYSPSAAGKPGSGTLYSGVGAMYVNPAPSWSVGDICEAYVHEFTHILSLDEARHWGSFAAIAISAPLAAIGRGALGRNRGTPLGAGA